MTRIKKEKVKDAPTMPVDPLDEHRAALAAEKKYREEICLTEIVDLLGKYRCELHVIPGTVMPPNIITFEIHVISKG